jgi:hypothetical protein
MHDESSSSDLTQRSSRMAELIVDNHHVSRAWRTTHIHFNKYLLQHWLCIESNHAYGGVVVAKDRKHVAAIIDEHGVRIDSFGASSSLGRR